MFRFLSLFVLFLVVVSCGNSVDLAIDNPTDRPIQLKVDSLEVEIPAKEVVWVEMGKGQHQITLQNDSIVNFDFNQSVYMVNPTLSEYLLTEEYYGSNAYYQTYELTAAMRKKSVTYLGIEFEGNYDVVKALINPVTWDYGPRETLPEVVQVEEGDNYTVLKKLLGPQEFIDMVQASRENNTAVE
ncbi:hypothetical protein [Costertonia aggregata]|uniref:Uncharacterized protein n=1 Tax=Costertonia aggregata TaxID=343403 RepID=A0A7H9ASN1_9FLAO|nr:hypothetical protein [Costertonia aggregata]QLG46450.1 hypothetical protein HYG79_14195 [Costertonia aggregata]